MRLRLQPPGIRHRVLEAGGGLEVVEVAVPASHETFADPGCPLPNSLAPAPPREFFVDDGAGPGGRQRFVFFSAAARSNAELFASGARTRLGSVDKTDTGILAATRGYASVSLFSPTEGGEEQPAPAATSPFAPAAPGLHLLFAAHGCAEVVLRSKRGECADVMMPLLEGDAMALSPETSFSLRFDAMRRADEAGAPRVLEVTIPELLS